MCIILLCPVGGCFLFSWADAHSGCCLTSEELCGDCRPSGYAELSYHGLEGFHLNTNRPIVVSVLWEVDPPLCPEKFEAWEPGGWVALQNLMVASAE